MAKPERLKLIPVPSVLVECRACKILKDGTIINLCRDHRAWRLFT